MATRLSEQNHHNCDTNNNNAHDHENNVDNYNYINFFSNPDNLTQSVQYTQSKYQSTANNNTMYTSSYSPYSDLPVTRLKTFHFKFPVKEFNDLQLNKCINKLIYGTDIKKATRKGKGLWHPVRFYILEDNLTILQWISNKKAFNRSRINLKTVSNILEMPSKSFGKKINQNSELLLAIQHSSGELVLCFDNQHEKFEWWYGLQHFVLLGYNQADIQDKSSVIARDYFVAADKQGNKTLDKQETFDALRQMHILIPRKHAIKIFNNADSNQNGELDYDEFLGLVKKLSIREELLPLFKKYCAKFKDGDYDIPCMTITELIKFFELEQNHQLTNSQALTLIHDSKDEGESLNDELSFMNFSSLIYSDLHNSVFNFNFLPVYQDMDRPLSDYYINSSHNTYLVSNQITGKSSVNAYTNALISGFRLVELDLWNGENAEPIVYHGHTLTSKIFFRDVCKAVGKYGFKNNPYPIIFSFEMHCDIKGQRKVATILEEELGSMIYRLPYDYEKYQYFPSPNALKYKIIIKGKRKLHFSSDYLTLKSQQSIQCCSLHENQYLHVSTGLNISSPDKAIMKSLLVGVENSSQKMVPLEENEEDEDSEGEEDEGEDKVQEEDEEEKDDSSRSNEKNNEMIPGDEDDLLFDITTPKNMEIINEPSVHSLGVSSRFKTKSEKKFESSLIPHSTRYSYQPPMNFSLNSLANTLIGGIESGARVREGEGVGVGKERLTNAFNSHSKEYSRIHTEYTPSIPVQATSYIDLMKLTESFRMNHVQVSAHKPPIDDDDDDDDNNNNNNNIDKDKVEIGEDIVDNGEDEGFVFYIDEDNKQQERNNSLRVSQFLNKQPSIITSNNNSNSNNNNDNNENLKTDEILHNKNQPKILSTELKPSLPRSHTKKHAKTCQMLAELYSMIGSKWSLTSKKSPWDVASINEAKASKFLKKNYKDMVNFHRTHITKIYPSGMRINSSNYNPVPSWNAGIQIVALNCQTPDESMFLNFAKFKPNASCGYVLKPRYLRHDVINHKEPNIYPNELKSTTTKLTIKIISGKQLRDTENQAQAYHKQTEIVDPFVEIKLRGADIDEQNNLPYKTHAVQDNGFNPRWSTVDKECVVVFNIAVPDLCTILLYVRNENLISSNLVGWYSIELKNMMTGYRTIPLMDKNFQKIHHSYILCHISIEGYDHTLNNI